MPTVSFRVLWTCVKQWSGVAGCPPTERNMPGVVVSSQDVLRVLNLVLLRNSAFLHGSFEMCLGYFFWSEDHLTLLDFLSSRLSQIEASSLPAGSSTSAPWLRTHFGSVTARLQRHRCKTLQAHQHIIVLELIALLNFLCIRTATGRLRTCVQRGRGHSFFERSFLLGCPVLNRIYR